MIISYPAIEQDAESVRGDLGLGDEPLPDAAMVLERAGLVVFIETLPGGPDGVYLKRREFAAVLLNGSTYLPRFRFTAGHELAHHLYEDYASHVDVDIFGDRSDVERRANSFSASFLMPRRRIGSRVAELGPGRLGSDQVARLASEFVVSYEAMIYRLHNLGYLQGAPHRDELMRHLGLALTEQLRERRPAEGERLPADFVGRALKAYQGYEISFGRLAELLRAADQAELAESLSSGDLLQPEDSGHLKRKPAVPALTGRP